MKQGLDSGMMTFEDSLLRRYRAGTITLDEALQNADSRTDLALRVRLSQPLAAETMDDSSLAVAATDPPVGSAHPAGWVDEQAHKRII